MSKRKTIIDPVANYDDGLDDRYLKGDPIYFTVIFAIVLIIGFAFGFYSAFKAFLA